MSKIEVNPIIERDNYNMDDIHNIKKTFKQI